MGYLHDELEHVDFCLGITFGFLSTICVYVCALITAFSSSHALCVCMYSLRSSVQAVFVFSANSATNIMCTYVSVRKLLNCRQGVFGTNCLYWFKPVHGGGGGGHCLVFTL